MRGEHIMQRLFSLLLVVIISSSWPAAAGTLERVRDSGEFKIGFREDAAPFSYKNTLGEVAGYSIDLCRFVAAQLKKQLALDDMKVTYVPITAENRFDAVQEGRIDILCGPTSVTLSRREVVDFSIFTFVDGASVLYLAGGPNTFEELNGKKVGVRRGTTTEEVLKITLEKLSLDAEVVDVADHADGLSKLEAGNISAYFADQAILLYLAAGSATPDKLELSDRHFTNEPYALALQRGDSDFRLLVDRTLVRLYRSGAIGKIFRNAFGERAAPSDPLKVLYAIHRLPE
jgi:ABC-type amino acid transport substrate-binding protein